MNNVPGKAFFEYTPPRSTPQVYRAGVTTADVVAPPVVGSTSAVSGGSLTADVYNISVVAGNAYGRATPTVAGAVTTASANLTARIPITSSPQATYYDLYVSTDSDPLWVARITQAQRAAGCLVTAVGTVTTGSIAGAVDVRVVGTGNAIGSNGVENTAVVPDSLPIVDSGNHRYVDFDVALSVTGESAADALVVAFLIQNDGNSSWYQESVTALAFGGAAGVFGSYKQRLRYECRSASKIALAVMKVTGRGASVDIQYQVC